MACDRVKRVIYFFLDGQLSDTKQQDLTRHLGVCPECERRANVHRRFREFIHRRLSRLSAPEHLKTRLTRSIRAFRAEWQSN